MIMLVILLYLSSLIQGIRSLIALVLWEITTSVVTIEVDKELLDLSDSTTDYRLKIVEGEKFGLKERTNESTVAVQSKVQFQKLIDRL